MPDDLHPPNLWGAGKMHFQLRVQQQDDKLFLELWGSEPIPIEINQLITIKQDVWFGPRGEEWIAPT